MKKLVFAAGMAVGYVLGARAGRKRYEQIRLTAQKLWETDPVQHSMAQAQDFAKDRAGDVADSVYSGAKKIVSSLVDKAKSGESAAGGSTSAGSRAARSTAPRSTVTDSTAGSVSFTTTKSAGAGGTQATSNN